MDVGKPGVTDFRQRIARRILALTDCDCEKLVDPQVRKDWIKETFGAYSAGTDDFVKRCLLKRMKKPSEEPE